MGTLKINEKLERKYRLRLLLYASANKTENLMFSKLLKQYGYTNEGYFRAIIQSNITNRNDLLEQSYIYGDKLMCDMKDNNENIDDYSAYRYVQSIREQIVG